MRFGRVGKALKFRGRPPRRGARAFGAARPVLGPGGMIFPRPMSPAILPPKRQG